MQGELRKRTRQTNTSRQRTDESHLWGCQDCLPPLRFAVSPLRYAEEE